jgi:[acyl-carrier-protein] S-malonyltransferase
MAEAAQQFEDILQASFFSDAQMPVFSNVDPTPETDAQILKRRLSEQMTGSVRWREIMLALPQSKYSKCLGSRAR